MSQDDIRYGGAADDAEWDDVEDEGVLDASDTLDDDLVEDPLDTGVAPPDRWAGADRYGTTAAEERAGESLDQLLAEEEPDIGADDDLDESDEDEDDAADEDELTRRGYEQEARAGRLVEEDEGLSEDEEADAVARDVGVDAGAAGAEEAAIHVVDDPNSPGDPEL
ncbi:MAG TPA: DUF5709 domain-containing protein [Streptosporangiaceae bacterium]|jgi:hypothetical protein